MCDRRVTETRLHRQRRHFMTSKNSFNLSHEMIRAGLELLRAILDVLKATAEQRAPLNTAER